MRRICCFLLAMMLCLLIGCGGREPVTIDGEHVVITVSAERIGDGTTLKQYMDLLVADGSLTYEMESGMLTTLGGIPASEGRYWMLYTDDAEYGVGAWGTCLWEGKTYASTSLGAETLPVKAGCTYIWYLQEPTV